MSDLRLAAEMQFSEELEVLAKLDSRSRPFQWKLSPWAVVQYLMGGRLENGFEVKPKYIGDRRLMEVAVATLATDRALLLLGVPGTAKSWVSEHLSAAICGNSRQVVQGTAGTSEEAIRYGWNYALLLSKGPSFEAVVPSPIMRAMQTGTIARVEELTRIPSDTQDGLITVLSEKSLPIPEINQEVPAARGFNVIATANNRDKGVNDLSSALKRRFNTVVLPPPATIEEEIRIVESRVKDLRKSFEIPSEHTGADQIKRVVQIFRELRSGTTLDGRAKIKQPSGSMSTAEAISVMAQSLSLAAHFGDGPLQAKDIMSSLTGAVIKDPVQDLVVWKEYLNTVVKDRSEWKDLYRAARDVV